MKNEIKKKAGRPPTGRTKKTRMSYVTDEVYAFFYDAGQGNFSKGLQIVKEKVCDIVKK